MTDTLFVGLDEAAYGPILGPMSVGMSWSFFPSTAGEVKDSKKIHKSGDLRPLWRKTKILFSEQSLHNWQKALEAQAKNWQAQEPWVANPIFGLSQESEKSKKKNEPLPHDPLEGAAKCMSALEMNSLFSKGLNKAEILGLLYGELLKLLPKLPKEVKKINLSFDRMGGRKSYGELLSSWGFNNVVALKEQEAESAYIASYYGLEANIRFLVKGDTHEELIGAASCLAKLARECFMLGFNHWWKEKIPSLLPTAGYPTDGKRFLCEIEDYLLKHNLKKDFLLRAR